MTSAVDIEDALRVILTASDEARRALLARLGVEIEVPVSNPRSPADLDDMRLPQGHRIEGPEWTDIANAEHETGWSVSWLRKYRRKLGVRRGGVWYLFRPRLALFPKPAPTSVNLPTVLNRVKS
jgi:hypothetical protein